MAQMIVELIKLASLIITLNKSMACADRVAGILKVDSTMTYPDKASLPTLESSDYAVAFDHGVSPMQEPAHLAFLISLFPQKKALRSESSAVPEAVNPLLWI